MRIKTLDRDVIVFPNGNLGKENICNFTLLDPLHAVRLKMPFSHADHPDLVCQTLIAVALSVDGILHHPLPQVYPQTYKNTHIEYEIRFFVTQFSQLEKIQNEFLSRTYYAIRRNQFSVPFPDKLQYNVQQLPDDDNNSPEHITKILNSLPLFVQLDQITFEYLTKYSSLVLFGIGEQMAKIGECDRAFYIILSGQILLTVTDSSGQIQTVSHLFEGDFLGEMVFFPGQSSHVSATVILTANVIKIEPIAITHLIHQHPKFAMTMSQFIDERKKLIRIAQRMDFSSNDV